MESNKTRKIEFPRLKAYRITYLQIRTEIQKVRKGHPSLGIVISVGSGIDRGHTQSSTEEHMSHNCKYENDQPHQLYDSYNYGHDCSQIVEALDEGKQFQRAQHLKQDYKCQCSLIDFIHVGTDKALRP